MRIVVLHAGGLGDLVLVESLFAALRMRYPKACVELACRSEFAAVASMYESPPDVVHAFPFNPYLWATPSELAVAHIRALAAQIGNGVDLFVSAELRPTWLTDGLSALLKSGAVTFVDVRGRVTNDVSILLRRLKQPSHPNARRLRTIPGEHELDRYARLAGADERRYPALRREENASARRWLAVFPLGEPTIKRWPLEHFAQAAGEIARRADIRVVVVGSEEERAELEIAAAAFHPHAAVSAYAPQHLAALRKLAAETVGYLGVDSGLTHVFAAYGVPGVTIFGGGTWPSYAPWRAGAAAVLAPLPCFGCGWDCAFGRGLCIEGVAVETVIEAFDRVLAGPLGPLTIELDEAYTERERAIIAGAIETYRVVQRDRALRLVQITRVRDLLQRCGLRGRLRHQKVTRALARIVAESSEAERLLPRTK